MFPSFAYTDDQPHELIARRKLAESVADIFESTPDLRGDAHHIRKCSTVLNDDRPKGWTCGKRFCPCCYGRQFQDCRPYLEGLPSLLAAHPEAQTYNLTLTVENVDVRDVRRTINHMQESLTQRLLRRKPFEKTVAYARATEVTRSKDGTAHPHIHAFVLARGGDDDNFDLADLWQKSARLPYVPAVHIATDRTPAQWMGYMSKPPIQITREMLADPPFLVELARQVRNAKMFGANSAFRRFAVRDRTARVNPIGSKPIAHYAHDKHWRQWSPDNGRYEPVAFNSAYRIA